MLCSLMRRVRGGLSVQTGLEKIYDTIFQVKDVTVIRKLHTDTPYFILDHKKMELPQKELLINFLRRQDPDEQLLEFRDKHLNAYHVTTPLSVICQESFYVYRAGYLYFVMNNLPLFEQSETEEFRGTFCTEVIEAVCRESLQELPENPKETISGQAMQNLLMANLLNHGMEFKAQKIRYKELMKIVNRRINIFEEEIREVQNTIEKKSSRLTRWFSNFLLLQYASLQYLIYFRYSWDILEPVTCVIGNFDLFCGYYFFVLKGREWSLGQLHSSYIEERRFAHLKKYGVDVDKYQEQLEIKEYLEFRLSLLSKNPDEIYHRLHQPFKLLHTH